MYKAVIFDMDGVLLDSQPFHFDADVMTLRECGFMAEPEDVVGYAGMASIDRWEKYKKDYNLDMTTEEMIKSHRKIKNDLLKATNFKAIDGIRALLNFLKDRGIKTAVASSSEYKFIYFVLDAIGVREYFDAIVSGEDMPHSKPHPQIFLETAKKLGLDPEECIVIEDSANGVMAAINADMKCVGYINPSSGEQDISKATITIDNFFTLINNEDWLGK